jgi:hypothetical protein
MKALILALLTLTAGLLGLASAYGCAPIATAVAAKPKPPADQQREGRGALSASPPHKASA